MSNLAREFSLKLLFYWIIYGYYVFRCVELMDTLCKEGVGVLFWFTSRIILLILIWFLGIIVLDLFLINSYGLVSNLVKLSIMSVEACLLDFFDKLFN